MERNDQIYKENLRIYSNINEIMNRRSNSIVSNDKPAMHDYHGVLRGAGSLNESAKDLRAGTSTHQNKNYFILRNKGMTKLKLNPIKREVLINKAAITSRKNSQPEMGKGLL